ncbi:adenine nucleotide alpha hydrolase [Rhizobium laguerreae]
MRKALEECLASLGDVSIAVSGGVDSLTLAVIATRLLGPARVEIMHAISAAVPREATERVEMLARSEGFDLTIIDAGEFSDPHYLRNPVNRCFFCKGNLYGAIAARSSRQVLSGTNLDDLGEYRPGLEAAKNFAVRHPFVEAGIGKQGVRQLARDAGLGALSEISASPMPVQPHRNLDCHPAGNAGGRTPDRDGSDRDPQAADRALPRAAQWCRDRA